MWQYTFDHCTFNWLCYVTVKFPTKCTWEFFHVKNCLWRHHRCFHCWLIRLNCWLSKLFETHSWFTNWRWKMFQSLDRRLHLLRSVWPGRKRGHRSTQTSAVTSLRPLLFVVSITVHFKIEFHLRPQGGQQRHSPWFHIRSKIFINITGLTRPKCTESRDAHARLISDTPAKSEITLTNGFRTMRGTEIPRFKRSCAGTTLPRAHFLETTGVFVTTPSCSGLVRWRIHFLFLTRDAEQWSVWSSMANNQTYRLAACVFHSVAPLFNVKEYLSVCVCVSVHVWLIRITCHWDGQNHVTDTCEVTGNHVCSCPQEVPVFQSIRRLFVSTKTLKVFHSWSGGYRAEDTCWVVMEKWSLADKRWHCVWRSVPFSLIADWRCLCNDDAALMLKSFI